MLYLLSGTETHNFNYASVTCKDPNHLLCSGVGGVGLTIFFLHHQISP